MNCTRSDGMLHESCYRLILETMGEGVCVVDREQVILYVNERMVRLFGGTEDDLIGRRCSDLFRCPSLHEGVCLTLEKGMVENAECDLFRKHGEVLPVLRNGRVLRDETGEIVGAVETVTDISSLRKVERSLEELSREREKAGGFAGVIGRSAPMREVFELISLAATSFATVLVTGETGTGKELVARAVHRQSDRARGPFVAVNCAALPENLLESELFGHARGAFTGAVAEKIGRFERADGGTLFLDEIGELSPYIQVKLLRFLQERSYERVGESITRHADVRIIAATNRDLRGLVGKGTFRDDLYYRLKVFPINLPPLRERREDIGPLVSHFVEKYNRETGKELRGLTHDAAVTLMDYCWPGNVRELENAIEHAFVTRAKGAIDLFDLPLEIRKVELRAGICQNEPASGDDSLTRSRLMDLLVQHNGHRGKTAAALGIDRTTLWRRMKKLGISKTA